MTDAPTPPASDEEHQGPVVRDKRRVDPVTGELREPATPAPAAGDTAAAAPADDTERMTDRCRVLILG